MGTRSFVLLIFLVMTAALTGCSDSEPQGRIVPKADYSGCDILPEVGEKAATENLSRDEIVVSPFFGKKYDKADLLAVDTASVLETTQYVKKLEVSLYKIPRASQPTEKEQRACTNYYGLETPRQQLKDKWDRFAGTSVGDGQLAGLYFEDCDVDCDDRRAVRPTILIDEQADRWTLVHEMMHHNFNLRRKEDPSQPSTPNLIQQLGDLSQKLSEIKNAYQAAPTRDLLAKMANGTYQLSQVLYAGLVRSAFEEMAVEGTLVDEWEAGRMKYVSMSSAISAVWYMEYSRDKGLEALNQLRSLFNDFVMEEASRQGWADVASRAQETNRFVNDVFQYTAELTQNARKKVPMPDQRPGLGGARKVNPVLLALTKSSHIDHHSEGDAFLTAWKNAVQNSSLFDR